MVADRLDVAERLAEGLPAVEHTQRYVRACQALGYENPDLTSRPSQVRDWYDSEVGLDLHTLDADCARLRAAGVAVLEALRIQRGQVADLAAAWTGPGADSAVAFLQRHCDAGSMVANELRAAAQRCETLRDNLWYLLDAKVANTLAIDDRSLAQRPVWLAAADAVTTGVGDRLTAENVIHQQVMPYVHNDIGNDWLDVMRSTQAGMATAYDMVTDRAAAVPSVYFEIPAELVAGGTALQPTPPSAPAPPVAVAPAAAVPATVAPAAAKPATVAPAAVPPTAPVGDAAAMPTAGDPGGAGSGLGGLGALASRIVDAMGSLLGPADDQGTRDPFGRDALDDNPFHPDDAHDDVGDKPDSETQEGDRPDETGKSPTARPVDAKPALNAPPPAGGPAPGTARPAVEGPGPSDAPPATAPAPAAGPGPAGGSTPCEIAADQLPQAGQ